MTGRRLLMALAVVLAAGGCNQDFGPEGRRLASLDDYELRDQTCEVRGDEAVATGTLVSFSAEPQGFGVVVRFLDGDVDLGRPQNVDHPELLAERDTWAWEASVSIDRPPADLRCNVIQVVIGDDVDR